MKAQWKVGVLALLLVLSGFLWFRWKQDEPRRICVQALQNLCQALNSRDSASLLESVVSPQAVANRTAAEQTEFLCKALQDEISPEGLVELRKRGTFGALKDVFPADAARWSTEAGAKPEDCVAFKMERAGVRAEAVLLREGQTFRIVRCNNVKQMAGGD